MANTKRKLPGWIKKKSYNPEFIKNLERGLVSIPKGEVLRSGNTGIDEVWGQNGKKYAKRLRNRSLRRKNKKIEE